jgi:hypothetical protein
MSSLRRNAKREAKIKKEASKQMIEESSNQDKSYQFEKEMAGFENSEL